MNFNTLWLAAAFTLAAVGTLQADTRHIAIASFGEHPALNSVADGFKERMGELGYVEGENVTYSFVHANFDRSLIPQVLQKVQAEEPDLAFLLTTGLNQAAVRGITDKSIPIVFGSVVDPVVAGIVPDWEHGSEFSTGASMMPNFNATFDFLKQVMPDLKAVGTLYNPGEDNDATNIKLFEEAAAKAEITLVSVPIENPADLPQRVQSLAVQADAIFLIQSNIVQTAIPIVAQVAQRNKIPVFNSVFASDMVEHLAGFHAISYHKNGVHAADLADRILKGERPASIPTFVPNKDDFDSYVSVRGMKLFGVPVPKALTNSPWLLE